jgi:lactose/L-arabinose transport system permease protein
MITERQSAPHLNRAINVNGWLFVAPALCLIVLFLAFPMLWSLWMSFQKGKGMNLTFAGFDNIIRLWHDPVFFKALGNTLLFLLVQVPIMLFLALLAAVTLDDPKLKFRWLFRTAIILPCVTSLVAYSVLFRSMFVEDGLINQVLLALHVVSEPIPWMTDPFWSRALIVIAITWRWTGYNMIFYLAALQNVDKSVFEAARVDGVPAYARFFRLTVPMLKPVILFTVVTSTIGTLQLFDEVANISANAAGTSAGPANSNLTLSLYIYQLTFKFMPSFGYAATVSWVIVILVAVFSSLQFWLAREKD